MFINNQDDLTLISSGTERDKNTLLTKYNKLIYGFYFKKLKNPDLAKELSQEALIKISNKINQYNTDYSFNRWVHIIISNHLIDYYRQCKTQKKQIETSFFDSSLPEIQDKKFSDTNSILDNLHYKELIQSIHEKAKSILHESEYKVYQLKFIEDYEYNDIELKLDISKKKLLSIISSIRKKIRNNVKLN